MIERLFHRISISDRTLKSLIHEGLVAPHAKNKNGHYITCHCSDTVYEVSAEIYLYCEDFVNGPGYEDFERRLVEDGAAFSPKHFSVREIWKRRFEREHCCRLTEKYNSNPVFV
ncbi:MAG: hypothetical protein GY861_20965 [bacterium]|nr:hypothetical protein [bacterium]